MGIGEAAREIGRCGKGDVVEKSECQRLLTVEKTACGGAPERGDRRVRLEEVGHDLCALHPELVPADTASEGSKGARQNAST